MTFYRNKSTFEYVYTINSLAIEKVSVIKDLGVILDHKLSFSNHIEFITTRAKSRLAWIRRFSKEFNDPWVIKKLFFTFVLPILEYASQVWSPKTSNYIKDIESIQKQFLLFALRKFQWPNRFQLPPYKHRLLLLHMNTLEDRRSIAQINFIQSLFNSNIYCPPLLSKLNIIVPSRRTRQYTLLRANFSNDPLNLMIKKYNSYSHLFELCESDNVVKTKLKTNLLVI